MTKIEGLSTLTRLEELYLSHNGIEIMEGLEGLVRLLPRTTAVNLALFLHLILIYLPCGHAPCPSDREYLTLQTSLQILDLSVNKISHIACVGHLTHLQEFWVITVAP